MADGGPFGLLTLEFWLYAARHPAARDALATRYRRVRDRLAEVIAERDATRDVTDARVPDEVATLVLGLDAGLFVQHLIDPETVTPELRASALSTVLDP